jgi:GTPase SAR1 family protein
MVKTFSSSQLVVVCGVDGCGKTTLCRSLQADLSKHGVANQIIWSRFRNYLSKPMLALTRLTGHNRRFYSEGEWLAHHDFSRLPIYREAFAFLQAIDVNIGTYLHVTRLRSRCQGVSICERGPWDTLVDVVADTGLDKMIESMVAGWYIRQISDAALVIFIQRDIEAIFASRPALQYDPTIVRRAEIYHQIALREGWVILDNNGSLEQSKTALSDVLATSNLFEEESENVA